MTFASLFSGGDLAGEGARAAGLSVLWGVECDPDIAAVAELNGTLIYEHKVQDIDFRQLAPPDWLHMSPPCINASVAKLDAGEAPEDIEMARGCIRAIQHFKSPIVSLENVWGYRNFESFQLIYAALSELSYQIRFWHLCAADYGVAQTRKRLILVASLKGTPNQPERTHSRDGHVGMFETIPKWVGWYEAIEDLISLLPESKFAEWQLERLSGNTILDGPFDGAFLAAVQGEASDKVDIDEPSPTITTAHGNGKYRAFLAGVQGDNRESNQPAPTNDPGIKPKAFLLSDQFANNGAGVTRREDGEPSFVVDTRPSQKTRAFLIRSTNTKQEGGNQTRESDDPAMTLTANEKPRAFLMPGSNTSSAEPREPREPREPSMTIGDTERVGNIPRAFIVDGKPANYAGDLRIVDAKDPSPTATATANQHPMRAWLSQGKVVALTVRALARLQSIPDTYRLPEKSALGCRVVGNAVPPLLMQRIIEAQTR